MTDPTTTWKSPYTPTPGSSTPSPHVTPHEQVLELKTFFWMALINTTIIGGSGVIAWGFATHVW
ncbi:MAG: hypothetical protein ACREB9_01465 [Thermoplasmata archaeon]